MRRLFALLKQWCTTEHAVCLLIVVFLGALAVAPITVEGAAPVSLPSSLDVPQINPRPVIDPERSVGYAAAHAVRSYLYMEDIGRGVGSLLWDPSEFAGAPFLAEWDARALSPFSLPVYFFGAETGLWISALFKIITAGAIAFYVARVLGFTHPFALFVAIAHALSAILIVWSADPVADTVVWVPMIFLFAERLSLGQLRYWPGAAIVIGLMALGGAPQAIASTFAYFLAYFVYRRTARGWKSVPGLFFSATTALVLGLGIAAAQILPWFEWLQHSRAIWIPSDAPGWVATAMPFGPLADSADATRIRGVTPLHTGLITILLGALWLVVRPEVTEGHRRRVDALLIISAVWLGTAILLSVLQPWAPVLQPILIRAFVAPLAFGLALGGAAAAEAWLQLRPAQSLAAIRRYAVLLCVVVALIAASYAIAWPRTIGERQALLELLTAALTLVIFVVVLGITLVRPWPRLMGYTLCVVTAAELLISFSPLQPRTPWAKLESALFAGKTADTRTGRVAFGPGTDSVGRIALTSPLMRGFGPRAPRRMAAFLERAKQDPLLYTRAGVSRFVLSLDDLSGPYSRLRPQLQLVRVTQEGAGLFEYTPGAQPTRLIHDLRMVSKFEASALDSSKPELVEAQANPGAIEGRLGRPLLAPNARIGEQRVNVFQNDPGVLVLAQTFYPDWSARVDGVTTPIFAVDGAFQGIELISGSREAVFRYSPKMFRWGLVASCVALSIALFGLTHLIYFRLGHQFFKM